MTAVKEFGRLESGSTQCIEFLGSEVASELMSLRWQNVEYFTQRGKEDLPRKGNHSLGRVRTTPVCDIFLDNFCSGFSDYWAFIFTFVRYCVFVLFNVYVSTERYCLAGVIKDDDDDYSLMWIAVIGRRAEGR